MSASKYRVFNSVRQSGTEGSPLTYGTVKVGRGSTKIFKVKQTDLEILDTLTRRVRVLSVDQIARTWWGAGAAEGTAKRRLNVLAEAGLLRMFTAMCHPEINLKGPAIDWSPGDQEPDFGSVSYQLRKRWNRPPIATSCCIATAVAGSRFGGFGGRVPRTTEQTHDLHLAAVYLHFRQTDPTAAAQWISEATILHRQTVRYGERLPDAMIDSAENPKVVEFGGAYPKEKLAAFHFWCAAAGYQYEVW